MSKKRALITGITGMVGSHLTDFLLKNTDWDIYGLYRWRSPLDNIEHLLPRINNKERIYLLYGDLRDCSSLEKVIKEAKPNFVFHLAAQSYPSTSFTSPLDTFDTNIIGTARLLEVIKEYRNIINIDPIIHICSSSEVYGRVSKDEIPIDEKTSFHPASPYAISKVGTDLIARFYFEAYKLKTVTTRMFTHTGPRRGDVFAESSFAKQIAMMELENIPHIINVGNLDSLRTWLDVRDAVKAYYMLVTVNPIPGECYNIGGEYTCTIREMLNYLLSISTIKDAKIKIDHDRLRPIDADVQVPNIEKFKKHTGWKPKIFFKKTMEDLLNYWREKIKQKGFFLNR